MASPELSLGTMRAIGEAAYLARHGHPCPSEEALLSMDAGLVKDFFNPKPNAVVASWLDKTSQPLPSTMLLTGPPPSGAPAPRLHCSSWWDSSSDRGHAPESGLLGQSVGQGAWCAGRNVAGEWISVQCGRRVGVVAVHLQGRGNHDQWVTRVELQSCADEQGMQWVSHGEYTGVSDRSTVVRLPLPVPTAAHWVRLIAKEWHQHISLRWDVEVTASQPPTPLLFKEHSLQGQFQSPGAGALAAEGRAWVQQRPAPTQAELAALGGARQQLDRCVVDWGYASKPRGWFAHSPGEVGYGRWVGMPPPHCWWSVARLLPPPTLLLSSGARPAAALHCSSFWDSKKNREHGPEHGVLNGQSLVPAWCAAANTAGQWISLDCGGLVVVNAVLLQGRGDTGCAREWQLCWHKAQARACFNCAPHLPCTHSPLPFLHLHTPTTPCALLCRVVHQSGGAHCCRCCRQRLEQPGHL